MVSRVSKLETARVKAGLCPAFTDIKGTKGADMEILITSHSYLIIAIIALGYFLQNHGWFESLGLTYRGY